MKPNRRFFQILLGCLAAILIIYGLLRYKFGAFLPTAVDKNLPDVIMFAAVGIMLWNRKQRNDEKKAEIERKRMEDDAAAARNVDAEETSDHADEPRGEGSADAPD